MMYLVLEELSLSKYLEYKDEGIRDDNPKRFHAHGTFLEALIYAIYYECGDEAAKKFCFEVCQTNDINLVYTALGQHIILINLIQSIFKIIIYIYI